MATLDAAPTASRPQPGPQTRAIIDTFSRYVVPNYRRFDVCLVRGEGSRVWDADGTCYLDLFPGWGCNLLGHCPAPVVRAVQEQVAKLIHVPNSWYIEPQGEWARLLSERSFGGQAFFCNSGTEANEAAIKLVRLRSDGKRYKIITFQGGFHGRTMGSVSATAQPKYHEGLGPMVAGFQFAEKHVDQYAVRVQSFVSHAAKFFMGPVHWVACLEGYDFFPAQLIHFFTDLICCTECFREFSFKV